MRRAPAIALAAALAVAPAAARAQGASSLLAGSPELEAATGELALLLAGRGRDGAPLPIADPQLFLDGKGPLRASGRDKMFDYAADHPKWAPPIAIGVVYLWSQGAPQTIMDGLEALFRQVPGRMAVYPTPYGQGYRKLVTKVTAARIAGGDLAEYPQMPGEHHKLVEALQFNLRQLADDRAPLKLMFIVTDGRGEPSRRDFSPFASVGEELRKAGVQVTILSFAPPADPAEATSNLQELTQAARARHIVVERPAAELPTQIESLAEVTAFERVRFELPWLARNSGGDRKLVVRATVGGAAVRAPAITVSLPGRPGTLLALMAVALAAFGFAVVAYIFFMRRRPAGADGRRSYLPPIARKLAGRVSRSFRAVGGTAPPSRSPVRPGRSRDPEPDHDHDHDHADAADVHRGGTGARPAPATGGRGGAGAGLPGERVRGPSAARPPTAKPSRSGGAPTPAPVAATGARSSAATPERHPRAHELAELVRLGVAPSRAVLSLAVALGEQADVLVADPDMGGQARGVLATRAGQARVREIRNLLLAHPPRETFLRDLAPILAGALREQISAPEAARRLRARLPRESWSALLRLSSRAAADAAAAAAATLPDLGVPSAASFVQSVRADLRRSQAGAAMAVWLVRGVPDDGGPAGQHIPVRTSAVLGGRGAELVLSATDDLLMPAHAAIEIVGGDATITPRDGAVAIDGSAISGPHPLHDGHTVAMGRGLYVVCLVRTGAATIGPAASAELAAVAGGQPSPAWPRPR